MIYIPESLLNDPRYTVLNYDGFSGIRLSTCESFERHGVAIQANIMVMVLEGEKYIHTEEKTVHAKAGDVVFIGRGHYVMSEVISPSERQYEALLFILDDAFILEFLEKNAIETGKDTGQPPFHVTLSGMLETVFKTFTAYFHTEEKLSHRLIRHKLEEALLLLLEHDGFRHYLASVGNGGNLHFKQRLENLADPFDTVESLIGKFGESPAHFRKRFKQVYGISPREWLLHKRLDIAHYLLLHEGKNVSQSCTSAGFASPSLFIRQFKNRFGLTPKQLQKGYKN